MICRCFLLGMTNSIVCMEKCLGSLVFLRGNRGAGIAPWWLHGICRLFAQVSEEYNIIYRRLDCSSPPLTVSENTIRFLLSTSSKLCMETWVRSLGQEEPLEKERTTRSSILAWKIPRMEEPSRLQSMGSQRVRHDWVTSLPHHYISGSVTRVIM